MQVVLLGRQAWDAGVARHALHDMRCPAVTSRSQLQQRTSQSDIEEHDV